MPTKEDEKHREYMRNVRRKGGSHHNLAKARGMALSILTKRYSSEFKKIYEAIKKDLELEDSHNLNKTQEEKQ